MKKMFRRNQIIITTLAVMIAAAGYLNYSAKKEIVDAEVYEVGMMEISDEDILAENLASDTVDDGSLVDIASLDGDGTDGMAGVDLASDGGAMGGQPVSGDPMAEYAGTDGMATDAGTGMAGMTADAGTGMDGVAADAGTGTDPVMGIENDPASAEAGFDNPGEAVLTSGTSVSEYIAGVQLNREQIRAKNKEAFMEIINSEQLPDTEKQAAIQSMIALTEISEKENAAETLLKAKGFVDPIVSITDGKVDVVVNAVTITDPERAQIEDIVKRKTEVGADGIVITLMELAE